MSRQTHNSKRKKKAPRGSSDKENDTASSFNTIDSCAPQKRVRELKRKRGGGRGGVMMVDAGQQSTRKRRRGRSAGVLGYIIGGEEGGDGDHGRRGSVDASTNTTSSYSLPHPLDDDAPEDTPEDDYGQQDPDAPHPSSPPLSPDTHLSHYRILRTLGHGNFSTTYLAETTPTEPEPPDNPRRLVAIKRLKRPLSSIGENEYSLLEFLHSGDPPLHVISPIEAFFSDSHFHLVLEPLDSARPVALPDCVCGHGGLACPRRHRAMAKILLQVLQGLLSLHSHGLIHADLTPANVLFLPGSNRVKIIDLGNTIRPEDRDAYLDDFGVQSACYRAPEMLLGVGPLSRVMDVWSAGVIGVEMLVGGEVVGEGLEGGELVRGVVEGREGMVGRVVELVGSVREYREGIYWRDVYDEISLEPVKRKRRSGGRRKRVEEREERKGMLRWFLEVETMDVGLVGFLMDMMEVGVSRRSTVMAMLRHPWLVRMMLGDWERVLTGEMDEVESLQDQSDIPPLEEEEAVEEVVGEVEEDVGLPLLNEQLEEEIDEFFGAPGYRDIREQSTDVLEANMEPDSSPPIERPITPFQSSPPPRTIPVTPPPPSSPPRIIPATPPPPRIIPATPPPPQVVPATPPPPSSPLQRTTYPPIPSIPPYHSPWHELAESTPSQTSIKAEDFSSPTHVFQVQKEYKEEEDTDNSVPETSLLAGDDTTRIFAREELLSSPPSSPVVGGYGESRSPSPVAMVGAYKEKGFEVGAVWDRDLAADMDSMSDEEEGVDEVMLC